MVGNLLPDFTKQIITEEYSPEVIQGAELHRFIDTFTDKHPVFIESKRRVSTERRRFSGVLVDIFYDHFLAIHWEKYSNYNLRTSTLFYYEELSKTDEAIPGRLSEAIQRMPKIDLLYNYRTLKGIGHAVDRISQRIRFKNNLHGGVEELENNFSSLESDFHRFFPDLQKAVAAYKEPSIKASLVDNS